MFGGTGSLSVTFVAGALPRFRSVSVYVRLLPDPIGVPVSAPESSRAGAGVGSCIVNAPRPCVPAASVRCDGSRSTCQIETIGKAVPSAAQWAPPS